MTSRPLVDPELRPLLDQLPDIELTRELLPALRAMPSAVVCEATPPGAVSIANLEVPGPTGAPNVRLAVYTPRAAAGPLPCVFHVHGGGFIAGSAEAYEPLHRQTVVKTGAILAAVSYRLAPETPFPGAIEDCYAGLAWVFRNAARLGIDPARIGVMGESAGGGLAAALALLARDRGELRLAFQHLIYPMLDDRTCTAPPHPYAGEFLWTASSNRFGWSSLLGHEPGREGVSPYAAPARAEDLAGLPPTFISTAALDLFVEENLEYARRLLRAGVPVELRLYPGAFHAFDLLSTAGVSVAAREESLAALARALAPRVA